MHRKPANRRTLLLGAAAATLLGPRALMAQENDKSDSTTDKDEAATPAAPASAAPTGSWTNPHFGTVLEWTGPWELGVIFGGNPIENKSPILNNTDSDDFVLFTTTDPFLDHERAGDWLDLVHEQLETLFFAPFRDGARDITTLKIRRRGTSVAGFFTYEANSGTIFELYDYRYDKETRLACITQMSALAQTARATYTSLRADVQVNGEPPVSTIEDDDILKHLPE